MDRNPWDRIISSDFTCIISFSANDHSSGSLIGTFRVRHRIICLFLQNISVPCHLHGRAAACGYIGQIQINLHKIHIGLADGKCSCHCSGIISQTCDLQLCSSGSLVRLIRQSIIYVFCQHHISQLQYRCRCDRTSCVIVRRTDALDRYLGNITRYDQEWDLNPSRIALSLYGIHCHQRSSSIYIFLITDSIMRPFLQNCFGLWIDKLHARTDLHSGVGLQGNYADCHIRQCHVFGHFHRQFNSSCVVIDSFQDHCIAACIFDICCHSSAGICIFHSVISSL